ncbi:hypothetical protein [Ornithinimicrobium sp. LYQ103]|uniref:hypothetical protein n=1 Tax=Ornithinimicrobium sp. LYQ103 TaxID=3378796 RepID=UPI003854B225
MSTDGGPPQQRALELVADAAEDLEHARALLVARCSVAVAAGLTHKTVAGAAGLEASTLRRWLAEREIDSPHARPGHRRAGD